MERQSVSSSVIASVGHDAAGETLEIEFTNGNVYQFSGVSQQVHDELIAADSVGGYFNAVIRHQYPYVRL